MDWTDARVLITGGCGLIGSHLARKLALRGAELVVQDNLSSGSVENLAAVPAVLRIEDISKGVAEGPFDVIYHLAGLNAVPTFATRGREILCANLMGLWNLLDRASEWDAQVVFASSSEVYGDPEVVPTPEEYTGRVDCTGPRAAYDEAKRAGEALALAYHHETGVDVRLPRIFNTYGEGQAYGPPHGKALTTWLYNGLTDGRLMVHGAGTQTRTFCYVEDMAEALILISEVPAASGRPINVGSDEEISIMEAACTVKALLHGMGVDAEIVHCERPPQDPDRRCPDLTRAREILGWHPRTTLETGLRKTAEWMMHRFSRTPGPFPS